MKEEINERQEKKLKTTKIQERGKKNKKEERETKNDWRGKGWMNESKYK